MLPFIEELPKALWKQHAVLWLLITVAFAVGFKVFSPNERLGVVEGKVDILQAQAAEQVRFRRVTERWMCIKSTPEQIALAGLECR
jgi:hypothetical protein